MRKTLERHCPEEDHEHDSIDSGLLNGGFEEAHPEAEEHPPDHSEHYGDGNIVDNLFNQASHRKDKSDQSNNDVSSDRLWECEVGRKLPEEHRAGYAVCDHDRNPVAKRYEHSGKSAETVQGKKP